MTAIEKILALAIEEVGYLEKTSNSNLYDKTANAGSANYTKYGYEMHQIYPSVMDFPAYWCDAFVDWLFYKTFGESDARILLCGDFNDYTPYSASYFQNKGQYHDSPQVGDVIFFTNGSRVYHTGIVYEVSDGYIYTIEGNTSDSSIVVANGGCVAKKQYSLGYSSIDGYGRPDYSIMEVTKSGFTEENGITRFYLGDSNTYVTNDWYLDNEDWYWFDGAGAMVTEKWYEYQDDWYYLDLDGKMVKGFVDIEGIWYCTDCNGKLITGDIALKTDENGAILIQ